MRIIMLAAAVLAALGTILYQTKTGIDQRQAQLKQLKVSITATQRDIALLEAEWAFLSRPDRIMALSTNLMDMKPITQDRILPLEAIPMRSVQLPLPADTLSCTNC